MHIELSTQDFERSDAIALVALIRARFPDLIPTDMVITGIPLRSRETMIAAINELPIERAEHVDPADAFEQPAPLDPAAAFGEAPLAPAATPVGAPSPVIASAPAGVEVDKEGLPWDARIHAGTKAKNADGRWKAKKGAPDDLKTQVTTELRAVMGAPPAPAAAPPPPPPPTPQDNALNTALAEAEAAAAPPPPPPPAPAASNTAGFIAAMQKVTSGQADGKITPQDVATIVASLGLASARDLMHRPDLVPEFEAQVASYIASA